MKLVCAVVGNRVAALETEERLPLRLESHVAGCLQCQAILARDRRLRRALSKLAIRTVAAPVGLVRSVETAIAAGPTGTARVARPGPLRRRLASPGAVAGVAAFAAGGAVVAAWRISRRPA